ncbi:TNF receptor-associated factor 3-like [Saccoglossus kowalevskii]|uniref:TNF receptor-associated factor 3-like isoform X1 n=1 Tax=Saccoglossus kowalevskii TaxID=10224 RepID=A0ABM0GK05_SACKO|nr:PREDICTED: TNF receptor-associated factor 3-like isoform X1 [Saccoglossus kowalevskii]XP_006812485.1 PREDICTED: TNF receptor-associated factor 3-like isoform X2 [Saccoglossus kowalevskii]
MAFNSLSQGASLQSAQITPPGSLGDEDGYDPKIFVKSPSNYVCHICQKVLRSPVQLECGHRFCNFCCNNLVKQSDKPVCPVNDCKEPVNREEIVRDHAARRDVLSLIVFCNFKSKGCNIQVKLKNLENHLQECVFATIDCIHKTLGCTAQVERRFLAEHLETECLYSAVKCKFCEEPFSKDELDQHVRRCPKAPVSCPNGCEVKAIPRNQLDKHLSECPLQPSECSFQEYGCNYRGQIIDIQHHLSTALSEHMQMILRSHEDLQLKHAELDRKYSELDNQKSIVDNKFKQQSEELCESKQKNVKLEERVKDLHKTLALQNDKIIKLEHDLKEKASKAEVDTNRMLVHAVQESCAELMNRVEQIEGRPVVTSTGGANSADVNEIRKQLVQVGTQLGMHDVRLAEQDLRFQVLETACYDGKLIWKIKNFARRKQEALTGKTLSLYSQPFYTSNHGYKMCARVYLNGDGMGKGTHMSLFFVVMGGDYDALLQWPFRQKVTLVLLDQETGRRNLSDTFRPDPTSSSFKRPTGDMNVASGCPLFVSQSVLETPTYIKNDTLYIKVLVDTSDLYGP